MKTAVALLTVVVVALLCAQLYLWHTEDSRHPGEPSRPRVQTRSTSTAAATDESLQVAPKELYWILIKMAASPDVAPQAEQRQRMVALLEEGVKQTADLDDVWLQSQDIAHHTFTADQRAFITRSLEDMRARRERISGGPMNDALIKLLRERIGSDFMSADLHQLLAQARALPLADPSAAPSGLNPEDFAWGVTMLENDSKLRLTREQAVQIAPFVKVQTELFQSHEREKESLLGMLNPRQTAFVRTTRAAGYNPNDPPFAEPGDLIKALR